MMKLQCYNTKLLCLFFFMAIFIPLTVSARCGAVNYSLGAQQLHNAAVFVGTITKYAVELLNAVAAILSIISALQIAIKMNYHEGDITKSVVMLIGSLLFLIGAATVMPAFFGYENLSFGIK